jgi:hypothetical protein
LTRREHIVKVWATWAVEKVGVGEGAVVHHHFWQFRLFKNN